MNTPLHLRLLDAAARLAAAEREDSLRRGVRPFVRLNLELVVELRRKLGGWNGVAAVLEAEGLRWRNGRAVSGAQLRALVAAVSARARIQSAPPPAPRTYQAPQDDGRATAQPNAPPEREAGRSRERPKGLASLLDHPQTQRRQ